MLTLASLLFSKLLNVFMIKHLTFALLSCSISLSASADSLQAHKVNSQLSPAIVASVPGQWTLVQLWALDCVVCEEQKPSLSALNTDYDELTVLGLSLDGLGNVVDVRERLAGKGFSFDNFIAELDSVRLQLQNSFNKKYIGTPTYILYSPKGEIVAVQAGPIDLQKLPNQLELTKTQVPAPALSPDLIR